MLEIIGDILLAINLILCGVLIGMNLTRKMFEETINEQQELIDIQHRNDIRILDVNIKYSNIIDDVLNENDYASAEYIKNKIKKALDDAGKQS